MAFALPFSQARASPRLRAGAGGMAMPVNAEDRIEQQDSPEERLWRAVISSTVQEWMNGPERKKREAAKFLFEDDEDYQTVCLSAGIDPENLRERLVRLRDRTLSAA